MGKFNAEIIGLVSLNVKHRKTLMQETLNRVVLYMQFT